MDTAIMSLDRQELYSFCDLLPEPIIARPVVTASRGRGLTLALEYQGQRVTLTEGGKPCKTESGQGKHSNPEQLLDIKTFLMNHASDSPQPETCGG